MRNPLEVEQQYQNLLLSLSLPATAFQRLHVIDHFLGLLDGEEAAYESYLLDCFDRVPVLVRDLAHLGHDPDEVRRIYDLFNQASQNIQCFDLSGELGKALTRLRSVACGLYAYAGAWEKLGEVLGAPLTCVPDAGTENGNGSGHPALRRLIDKTHDLRTRELLEYLAREWDVTAAMEAGRGYVPVVERSVEEGRGGRGSLRRLRVRIIGESREGHDVIQGDLSVFGVDREETSLTQIPMEAVHTVLRKMDPRLVARPYIGQISFGRSHELLEGDSAQLAAGVLLACEILRYENRRVQFRVRPDVALTGSMDAHGCVCAVDGGSLPAKVKAAFFSHVGVLVVPREQVPDAESADADLRRRYPRRQLAIVGVAHVREVFYDRRVVEEVRAPLPIHMARTVAKHKAPIAAVTATFGLLLLIGHLILGPIDKTPADVEFAGNLMRVVNQFGETIMEADVGGPTVEYQRSLKSEAHHPPVYGISNQDGMDSTFVVFLSCSSSANFSADRFCKWSVSGRQVWGEWRSFPIVDFPNKNYEARGTAHWVTGFVFAEVDGRPGKEVVVLTHHPNSFPCTLVALDWHTMREVAEYLHVGFINDLRVFDIDADGRDEILCCGINNAYRMACVVVLDPNQLSGCSPATGEYVCRSHPPAAEKFYILIPRTVVGEATHFLKNNDANWLEVDQGARQLVVHVVDGISSPTAPFETAATLNYRFDSTMRLATIAPGDSYDLLAESLVKEGKLRQKPDQAYFEAERSRIRYWDGEKWQTRPTENRRFTMPNRGELLPR
jgi:hypothetical protein